MNNAMETRDTCLFYALSVLGYDGVPLCSQGPPGPPGPVTSVDGPCKCEKGDKGDRGKPVRPYWSA